ncbi:MAG: M50 family metallopeptidase [Tissierellia bacterium]|nr:M50 family metallopeptidase [Tissierellia bacterium]
MKIVIAFAILMAVVTIHEYGHYIAAKLTNVMVYEFSIGFGPVVFKRRNKETKFTIRALPLGGFCRFDATEEEESKDDLSSNHLVCLEAATVYKRLFIALNGIIFNFILAFILLAVFFLNMGEPIPVVDQLKDQSPAAIAGVEQQDRIVAINGEKVNTVDDLLSSKMYKTKDRITLTIERNHTLVKKEILFNATTKEGEPRLGIQFKTRHNLLFAGKNALFTLWQGIREVVAVLLGLFTRGFQKDIMGPVGFANFVHQVPHITVQFVFLLIASISISLGVFNLIPIPPLDGGRAVFYIFEMIFKRPLSKKVESVMQGFGIAFLFYLFMRTFLYDIGSLL